MIFKIWFVLILKKNKETPTLKRAHSRKNKKHIVWTQIKNNKSKKDLDLRIKRKILVKILKRVNPIINNKIHGFKTQKIKILQE